MSEHGEPLHDDFDSNGGALRVSKRPLAAAGVAAATAAAARKRRNVRRALGNNPFDDVHIRHVQIADELNTSRHFRITRVHNLKSMRMERLIYVSSKERDAGHGNQRFSVEFCHGKNNFDTRRLRGALENVLVTNSTEFDKTFYLTI
eukprot:722488-Prorocentrum_minimum.AAC.1